MRIAGGSVTVSADLTSEHKSLQVQALTEFMAAGYMTVSADELQIQDVSSNAAVIKSGDQWRGHRRREVLATTEAGARPYPMTP